MCDTATTKNRYLTVILGNHYVSLGDVSEDLTPDDLEILVEKKAREKFPPNLKGKICLDDEHTVLFMYVGLVGHKRNESIGNKRFGNSLQFTVVTPDEKTVMKRFQEVFKGVETYRILKILRDKWDSDVIKHIIETALLDNLVYSLQRSNNESIEQILELLKKEQ